jgi:hypothetical protein
MVYLLWDESDCPAQLVGVFQTAQEAFDNRCECWMICQQSFGIVSKGYGRQMWASWNSHDGRQHLAMVQSEGDYGFALVGIDRVVGLLS